MIIENNSLKIGLIVIHFCVREKVKAYKIKGVILCFFTF